jgi:hypothetical protein
MTTLSKSCSVSSRTAGPLRCEFSDPGGAGCEYSRAGWAGREGSGVGLLAGLGVSFFLLLNPILRIEGLFSAGGGNRL